MLTLGWSDMIRAMPATGGYIEIKALEMKLRVIEQKTEMSGQLRGRGLTHKVSQPLYPHWTAVLLFLDPLSTGLLQIHAVTSTMSLV
jgi:hypothetical protein